MKTLPISISWPHVRKMKHSSLKSFMWIGIIIIAFTFSFRAQTSLSLQPGNMPSALNQTSLGKTETNTSQLIELSRLTTLGAAYGFAIQGTYAYIATGSQGYLKIVDIANPSNPQVISQWQCQNVWICDTYGTAIWQVDVSGDYAYLRGGGNIYILDISDPETPQLINYLFLDNSSATPFKKYGNNLYTEASNFDGSRRLDVVDVSNPLDLDRVMWSEIDYPVIDLVVQGDYLYTVADGIPGQLLIYDISQGVPSELAQRTLNGLTYGLTIVDNYAYVGDLHTIHIIDVSTPANPSIQGSIGNNQVGFVVDLHSENNVLYVNQKYDNLIAFSIANRENPINIASYPLSPNGSTLHQVDSQNGYVYTTDSQNFYILAHKPATTTIIPIPPPTGSQVFSIIWGDISYARTAYELQEQHDGGSWNLLYSGSEARYELSRQLAGEWCYRVRLLNGHITGDWSLPQCFTIPSAPKIYLPFTAKSLTNLPQPTLTPLPTLPPAPTSTPTPTAIPDHAQFPQQVVALVNAERTAVGCDPVTIHGNLNQAAFGHSQDMALNDFFSHTGSNGSHFTERIIAAGYTNFSTAGENIAAGYTTPEDVMNGWMNSPGHRNNILNCAYQHIGVGHYYLADDTGSVNYHHYWTQVFASP